MSPGAQNLNQLRVHGRAEARLDRVGEQHQNAHFRSALRRARPGLEAGKEKVLAGGEVELRVLPRDHLARIEQAAGIGLALERELDRIGLFHAPLLEGVTMGVEDHRAHGFVLSDDLHEPRLGGELDQRQAGESDPAVEADQLEMSPDLVAIKVMDALDQLKSAISRIADLKISY